MTSPPRPCLKSVLLEKEFGLLFVAGILYFFGPLFLDETLFFRDLYSHFLPQKKFFVDTIRSGQLPLWNPFIQGGEPFIGNLNNIPLYPSNFLYLFLPMIKAFNWDIVLHVIACAAGAYLFARVLGLKPVAALITGFVFGFCGYNLSLTNNLNRLLGMPYIPLLFLSWHLFLSERSKKWFALSVAFGVLQFLAGAPDVPVTTLLSLLGWNVFFRYDSFSVARKLKLWLLLLVFIIGISSVQIFPLVEMVRESPRSAGITYTDFVQWSLHPKRLPELMVPNFLGDPTSLDSRDYWGDRVEKNNPLILSIYFGSVVLLLAIAGAFFRTQHQYLTRHVRLFLIALFGVSVILSLGEYLPLFEKLYAFFPPVRLFRYPLKFLTGGLLPVAILAGIGTQSVLMDDAPGRRLLLVFWSAAFCLFLLYLGFLSSNPFSNGFVQFFFERTYNSHLAALLAKSFLHTAVITGLAALLFQYRRIHFRSSQPWILATLVVVDLLVSNSPVNPTAPASIFAEPPPLVNAVRSSIDQGRLYRYEKVKTVRLKAPTKEMYWWAGWDLQTLRLYIGASYGIPIIFHEDLASLSRLRILTLRDLLKLPLSWNQKSSILSAGAVTLILTDDQIDHPSVKRIAAVHNPTDTLFYLYRNLKAAPSTTFVTDWMSAKSANEALRFMLGTEFDPRQNAVVENGKSGRSQHRCDAAAIREQGRSNTSTTFSVQNVCDGYLVFAEPYYPGWRTYVDGRRVPVLRANFAFSSVYLEPGTRDVKRVYRPMSLFAGGALSLVFAGLLCLLLRWKDSRIL